MTIREKIESREKLTLSPRASLAVNTMGRDRQTIPCSYRTDYQRDRDRILHCNSFRRLMHKTQVFLSPEGDHYRTRLTHTLEVAQVAKTVARALNLNEDLAEAIALGHDLGHTPFGHAGEDVLNRLAPQGYHHSQQSVRIVEFLENNGEGLNLTKEVRDGINCHSGGPIAGTLEGQLVRYSDKIAYMNHDIEDAIRGGIITTEDIPLDIKVEIGVTKSARLTSFITDLVENSEDEIKMSPRGQQLYDQLKDFMFTAVYTNSEAKKEEGKAMQVVAQLYNYFLDNPDKLPKFYRDIQVKYDDVHIGICDYLSGMSDRYCVTVYENLFVPRSWELL